MKIGVISSTILGPLPVRRYAGLEIVAWHCARGLAELGHEVYLFSPDGSTCPGVTIVPFGPAGYITEQQAFGGFPDMKDHAGTVVRSAHRGYWQQLLGLDCIISHDWNKHAYQLKAEGRLKAPILGVCHAPVNTMFSSLPPVEKPCMVTISQDQANHFEALFSRQAKVCRNGIELPFYRSMNVPRTKRYLFLARFSTIKGPDLAIEACRAAGVGLDLVGDTSITNEPELYQRCREMSDDYRSTTTQAQDVPVGSDTKIRIVGPCSRGETVWWYSQAHCMLHLNQRFREPLGLAPLESQSCGCPVIAWRYGAMTETVKHGETGFLVDSMAGAIGAIRQFEAMDAAAKQHMRNAAVEWAQQFSIDRMCKRYEDLCKEAVETGGW